MVRNLTGASFQTSFVVSNCIISSQRTTEGKKYIKFRTQNYVDFHMSLTRHRSDLLKKVNELVKWKPGINVCFADNYGN